MKKIFNIDFVSEKDIKFKAQLENLLKRGIISKYEIILEEEWDKV